VFLVFPVVHVFPVFTVFLVFHVLLMFNVFLLSGWQRLTCELHVGNRKLCSPAEAVGREAQ